MNKAPHYTDEDFQAYCDGQFLGNVAEFSAHIQLCELCRMNLQAYQSIFSFAKDAWPEPSLGIDLVATVNRKIPQTAAKRLSADYILYGVIAVIALTILVLCSATLVRNVPAGMLCLLMLPFALYFTLSIQEQRLHIASSQ